MYTDPVLGWLANASQQYQMLKTLSLRHPNSPQIHSCQNRIREIGQCIPQHDELSITEAERTLFETHTRYVQNLNEAAITKIIDNIDGMYNKALARYKSNKHKSYQAWVTSALQARTGYKDAH
eukprot:10835354-Karenia_brevis.AAC.1